VIRQSSLTTIAAAVAIGSGLLLDLVVAAAYGADASTDAFVVAARIPLALTAILMVLGNQVLVPSIATWLTTRSQSKARSLTTTALLGGITVTAALAGLLFFASPWVVGIVGAGFDADGQSLAVRLSQVMVWMIPLTAISEILRAWLNAHHYFVVPAGMTLALNVVASAVILTLAVSSGDAPIEALPWAFVLGAAVQALLMSLFAVVKGLRLARPDLRDPEVAHVSRLMLRPTGGAALNPLARVAETAMITLLVPATGAVTVVYFANRLVSAAGGSLLFRSVIIALLPRLTRSYASAGSSAESFATLTRTGVRMMLVIGLPLTTLGVVLAAPASDALYNHGQFDSAEATLLGIALAVYAVSFAGSGVQRALLAPYYAMRNTRVPLRNTVYGVLANMGLLVLLLMVADAMGSGATLTVLAVAAAYSLAQYVNVGHAWYRMRHDVPVDLSPLSTSALRSTVAALAGAVAAGLVLVLQDRLTDDLATWWGSVVWLAIALLSGIVVVTVVELTDPAVRSLLTGRWSQRARSRQLGVS
jgi:murein biosynthesis integral membrane protein MurJ